MKTELFKVILSAAALIGVGMADASTYTLKSPSGKLVLTVNTGSQLTWSASLGGREIIAPSVASVTLTDGSVWGPGATGGKTAKVDRTIKTVNYKNATVRDQYESLSLKGGKYTAEFRVYDDAVAYRFVSAGRDSVNVKNEMVQYNLTGDAKAWIPWVTENCGGERYSCSFESYYNEAPISQMPSDKLSILPLLADMGGGVKVAVTDVGDLDYPGMYIHSDFSHGNGLRGEFAGYPDLKNSNLNGQGYDNFVNLFRKDYIARIGGRQALSWKVAVIVDNDPALADCAIVQKLCAGTSKGDFSWVKPGKVSWDWWNALNITGADFASGMNTPTYKRYIDFAAANKLEYIIIDDGWKEPRCVDACSTDALTLVDEDDPRLAGSVDACGNAESGSHMRYINQTTNWIAGMVVDPAAAEAVIGAKVTFTSADGTVACELATDDFGEFHTKNLPEGAYTVTVEADGFAPLTVQADSTEADVMMGELHVVAA